MGRWSWRERGTRLGCRRGWIRLAGLAAFVLVGYFALYAWLRATGNIVLWCAVWRVEGSAKTGSNYMIILPKLSPNCIGFIEDRRDEDWSYQPMWIRAMWPAIKLEIALDRYVWLPQGIMGRSYDEVPDEGR